MAILDPLRQGEVRIARPGDEDLYGWSLNDGAHPTAELFDRVSAACGTHVVTVWVKVTITEACLSDSDLPAGFVKQDLERALRNYARENPCPICARAEE